MTQKDLFPTVTFSQLVIPVSPSPSRESKKAQKTTATSGRLSLELLHKKDRLGAFSKTFMVTLPWASTKCCLTWKPKATPQGRLLFQLQLQALPIKETDSGLWPTPTARDYKGGRTLETLAKVGRNETNSLPDAVNSQMGKTGPLNPTWVEWLMGYPEGWTDLKD